jgi:hypothetical protein
MQTQPRIAAIQIASRICIGVPLERFVPALRIEAAEAPSVMVNVVDVTFPLGVSIGGLNEAVDPAGSPETLNEIELGNPFAVGVAVI